MLGCVGNVTLPTPLFVAGGALCILAGYLAGAVAGSGGADRPTATVASYDADTSRLCLSGEGVQDSAHLDADSQLCGTWSHSRGWVVPQPGDRFRYVALDRQLAKGSDRSGVVIFGTVVK